MKKLAAAVLDLLYPPRCMLCHRLLPDSKEPICSDCAGILLRQQPPIRRTNGRIFSVSPYAYEEPLRGSLHRFKFGGRTFYSREFARWMAACLRQTVTDSFDLITWVPVSLLRRWSRGYDQSELLCRELSGILGLPMARTLRKIRNNPPQSGTDSASCRKRNVRGVYRTASRCDLRGKSVLLVDDVTTTGSTLRECVKILKSAGAAQVICVTLAATV